MLKKGGLCHLQGRFIKTIKDHTSYSYGEEKGEELREEAKWWIEDAFKSFEVEKKTSA